MATAYLYQRHEMPERVNEIVALVRVMANSEPNRMREGVLHLIADNVISLLHPGRVSQDAAAKEARERMDTYGGGTSTETGKGKPARSERELAGSEAG